MSKVFSEISLDALSVKNCSASKGCIGVPTVSASAEMVAFRPVGAFRSVMIVEVAESAILVTSSLAANIGVTGGNSLGVDHYPEGDPLPDLSLVGSTVVSGQVSPHFEG